MDISRTTPHDPPIKWDDLLEVARSSHIENLAVGDGPCHFDIEAVWDVGAVNGVLPARPDDWAQNAMPGEVALFFAEAESYCHT